MEVARSLPSATQESTLSTSHESAIADDCGRRPVDRGVQPSGAGAGGAKDGLGQVSGHLVSRHGDARRKDLAYIANKIALKKLSYGIAFFSEPQMP